MFIRPHKRSKLLNKLSMKCFSFTLSLSPVGWENLGVSSSTKEFDSWRWESCLGESICIISLQEKTVELFCEGSLHVIIFSVNTEKVATNFKEFYPNEFMVFLLHFICSLMVKTYLSTWYLFFLWIPYSEIYRIFVFQALLSGFHSYVYAFLS